MDVLPTLWVVAAVIVALVAAREFGRSALAWFLLALVVSPVVGALLFVLPPRRVPCATCAELIKPSAVVCRFCGRTRTPDRDGRPLSGPVRVFLALVLFMGLLATLSRCEGELGWWSPGGSLEVEGR